MKRGVLALVVAKAVLTGLVSEPTPVAARTAGAPSPGALTPLLFDAGAVTAEGVTAGGTVVWFAVSVERDGYFDTVRRPAAAVVDEDGDRSCRFEPEGGVPDRSVWAAVDFATGGFAIATPGRAPWFEEAPPPNELVEFGSAEPLVELRDARGYAEILLVRPGVGAWTVSAADGGPADADGANDGLLEVPLDRLEPLVGAAPPPSALASGDVVVTIDPVDRGYYAIRLAGGETR